jgi:uncharacterized repeat protein (TIGR01451 family)
MKIRYLLVPCVLALGLGLVLALLWLLDGGMALAAAEPVLGEARGPSSCPLRASSGVITVCLSGGCDYTSIQAAVDAANDGDVIKVAAGTYTDGNDYGGLAQVVYVSKTVTIRGGYTTAFTDPPDPDANPTTLDAQGRGRVLYITGGISPTIEGLRITGGDAAGLGGGPGGDDAGGGVYVISASAIINNDRVFGNTVFRGWGGGLYLQDSAATLSGNTVSANTAEDWIGGGGGLCLDHSDATLISNTVTANSAYEGGGLYLGASNATLVSNTVTANWTVGWDGGGGGLYLYHSDATLNNNTVSANATANDCMGGGLYLQESAATLDGNVVSDNRANIGAGGLYLYRSDATLSGNVVTSNSTYFCGGGLYLEESDAMVSGNTVIANETSNCGGGVYLEGSEATLSGNVIVVNHAGDDGGGLELSDSDALLTSNVIADNRADIAGSGLYIAGSSPRLLHTTIARNSGGDGSGVYVTDLTPWGGPTTYSTVALTNTILVSQAIGVVVTGDNAAALEATLWGSGAWANTTDWGGAGAVTTGTVNLWDAPAFVDPGGSDYHINSSSAARNAGIDAGVGWDMDGEVRPMDWDYDIGADEYPGVGLEVAKQPSAFFLNPDQAFIYTIVVTSAGTGDATGVVLTDTMDVWQRPSGAASSLGSCDIVDAGWGGTVVCSPGTIATGKSVVVTLTAQVSTNVALRQAMANTVVVTANETRNGAQVTTHSHDCHARINDDPTEYVTVQAAVDAAGPGDVVKVAGVCMGASARGGVHQQVYLDKSLTIRGGYTVTNWMASDPETNRTTLDAFGQGRVLYISGDVSPTVEGLHVTGGDAPRGGGVYVVDATATVSNNLVFGNTASDGGGLYLSESAATLSGNTVSSNTASYGGGLYLYSSAATLSTNTFGGNVGGVGGGGLYLDRSDATVSENIVIANIADYGGGLYLDGSPATLSGSTVISNTASYDGGGLYVVDSAAALSRNTITANVADDGGGLYLGRSDATVSENIVIANIAGHGGGLYLDGSPATLSGNTVTANIADDGGGLHLSDSDATLINNIVAANRASRTGSGLRIVDSSPRLLHTTIAGNSGGDGSGVYASHRYYQHYSVVAMTNTILTSHTVGVIVTAGSTATLEATLWGSDAWANDADWGGAGTVITGTLARNTWGDPDFAGGGDYHIGSESAAIDRGVNAGVVEDMDGDERPVDGDLNGVAVEDLGADEFTPRRIYLPLVLRQ